MQDSQNLPNKEELEIAKLKLEIAELQKPFWKRSSFVLAGLPTVLAVATLAYGIASGYFSASFVKLENQKHDLEREVREFTAQKSVLHNQNEQLRSEQQKLESELAEFRTQFLAVRQSATNLVMLLRDQTPECAHKDVTDAANRFIRTFNTATATVRQ